MRASIIKALVPVVAAARDLPIFSPDEHQRRARAAFWAAFSGPGAPGVPQTVDLATARLWCNDSRISAWWGTPGFQDWFTNSGEYAQRVEYLSQIALDQLELVMADPKARSGDRLVAAKMILELADRFPRKTQDGAFLDAAIAAMGRAELETFIANRLERLSPAVVELPPSEQKLDT